MSAWRQQLPVHSPLTMEALRAAIVGWDERVLLETELQQEYGSHRVVLTDSGTTALALALRGAAARRPGAPCALPAYGCFDLATAALAAGVRVVLYDLDPSTLAPEPASLRRALRDGAAALVVVHQYGIPVPMDAMRTAADSAGAILIEDAAQGAGGSWRGRPLGSIGDLGVLSFGRGKGITGGGGGALLVRTRADELGLPAPGPASGGSDIALIGKLFGQWILGRPSLYRIPSALPFLRLGDTVFRRPSAATVMSTRSARVLRRTRPLAAAETARRRAVAVYFHTALIGRSGVTLIQVPDGAEPGWLRFPVLARGVASEVASRSSTAGVVRGYPIALSALTQLMPLLDLRTETPGADVLASRLLTLPTHGYTSDRDRAAIAHDLGA